MDKIASFSDNDRSQLFAETSAKTGLPAGVVEKDFWVCWILWKLFNCPDVSKHIIFKGGTSLSKVYGLIERFSEDIDLILDWREITDEDPLKQRSKTMQDTFNKALLEESAKYLAEEFYPRINALLEPVCQTEPVVDNPHALKITFPTLFSSQYLRPEILLETGPLAAWTPNERHIIYSYAAKEFPALFETSEFALQVISAERTFWEKVTILHHEAHRPEGNLIPTRYSRHYYDVFCMARSKIKSQAFNKISLLAEVAKFKDKFYPRGWARYDMARPGTLKLVPPKYQILRLEQDYGAMKEMVYGNYPSFEAIIQGIAELESEINSLNYG